MWSLFLLSLERHFFFFLFFTSFCLLGLLLIYNYVRAICLSFCWWFAIFFSPSQVAFISRIVLRTWKSTDSEELRASKRHSTDQVRFDSQIFVIVSFCNEKQIFAFSCGSWTHFCFACEISSPCSLRTEKGEEMHLWAVSQLLPSINKLCGPEPWASRL